MNPAAPKLPPQGHLDSRASKLARVFSRDSGVRVEVVPGVVPHYNQTTKQIEIPSEIDDMGVGLQKVVEGFLEHEVCHARTWKRMEEERAAGKSLPDFLHMVHSGSPRKTVLNALLDAHDELANPNAGSRDMIRDVHEWAKRAITSPKSKASPLLEAACDMFTRAVGSGPLGVQYEKPATEKAIAECAEIVRGELSKGWDPRAVANLLDPISRRLAAALEEEEKAEAKPQPGSGDKSKSEGKSKDESKDESKPKDKDEGKDEDAPKPSPSSDDSAPDDGSTDDGSKDGGDGEGSGETEGDEEGAEVEGDETEEDDRSIDMRLSSFAPGRGEPTSFMEAAAKDLEASVRKDFASTKPYLVHPDILKHDRIEVAVTRDSAAYGQVSREVAGVVGALRNKLISTLIARRQGEAEYDQEQGYLDTTALHTLACSRGIPRVFYREVDGAEDKPSIAILADESGSMICGGRDRMAMKAALAISECLSVLGVDFAVYGFTNSYVRGLLVESPPAIYLHGRALPLTLTQYKGFDEDYRRIKLRMTGIHAKVENSDGDAVLAIAKLLMSRGTNRRILVVVSDGEPACPSLGRSEQHESQHLLDVLKEVHAAGIETLGVGIQTDAVRTYYPNNVVVQDLPTLPVVMFKALSKLLLEYNRKAR